MIYALSKQDKNKLIKFDTTKVVVVPESEFSVGDVIIMFNASDEFMTIQSKVKNSYVSARRKHKTHIEFPPKGLVNLLFIDSDTVVASGDAS
jgi:hypothetical protein